MHGQVPQLLRIFGFDAAVLPGFLSTITWLTDGISIHHGVRGLRYLNGRELVWWRGLDGTEIPLLLHQPIPRDRPFRQTLAHEQVIGRLGIPRLLIDLPDMVDVDDACSQIGAAWTSCSSTRRSATGCGRRLRWAESA